MKTLNLPTNKTNQAEKFDNVSFVNQMSHYSLKVLVKHLWENLQGLANVMEDNRADVTQVLDQIMSGEKWSEKNLRSRFTFMIHNGEIIQYDSSNNEFKVLAVVNNAWTQSLSSKAMSYDELIKTIRNNQ